MKVEEVCARPEALLAPWQRKCILSSEPDIGATTAAVVTA